MNWVKRGRIFSAQHYAEWMNSHVQNPCPVLLADRIRVFFNTRPQSKDGTTVSHPVFIDLDLNQPTQVLGVSNGPVLSLGEIGCFDQFGCMTSSVIRTKGQLLMYFVGWTRGVGVPYNWAIGLARSNDEGNSFQRVFKGPIIGAQFNEPYLQNGCYVYQDNNSEDWHIWYSTGVEWFEVDGKMESRYLIAHATSNDGVHWLRDGHCIIDCIFDDETQTTPTIFKYDGKYHMIFSSRHSLNFRNAKRGYRLGYAWSDDLIRWNRDDSKIGISTSPLGWDSDMICYPQVIRNENKLQLFYCGNYFGIGGLGYAEIELEGGNL